MPVYEYQCKACSREFEYQQRMTDPDKTTCEVCGGALDRLISRTAFSLKGGGWYKDLYSSPKPENTNGKTDAGAKADAGAKTDAASPAPAAKPADGASSTSSGSASSSSVAAAKAP